MALLVLLVLVLAVGGCALDEKSQVNNSEGNIPWNRPQTWEGPGVMGSMMQGSH